MAFGAEFDSQQSGELCNMNIATRMFPARWVGAAGAAGSQLFADEQGEIDPGSYLLAVIVALWFILFAFDLGLRKAARVTVEYAAFCAARAAAVNYNTYSGGKLTCNALNAQQAATRAAAACMAAVVAKTGTPDPTRPGAISALIDRAQKQVSVTLDADCNPAPSVVTATVIYTYTSRVPLSPLTFQSGPATMTAHAQYMVY